jgi:hypothetical protein
VKDLKSGRLAPTMVEPTTVSDLVLTFDVPPQTRPVLLILRLDLENLDTNSQWNLTP